MVSYNFLIIIISKKIKKKSSYHPFGVSNFSSMGDSILPGFLINFKLYIKVSHSATSVVVNLLK